MKTCTYLAAALLTLCSANINAQCNATGSHYTASYPAGWNFFHTGPAANAPSSACDDNKQGNIWSSGTGAWFFTARGGREMRISRDIPPVSDNSWTMDFTLHITAAQAPGSLENNSPAVVLASLTNTPAPIMEGCSSGNNLCESCNTTSPAYAPSNVDAMWVALTSLPPTACQEDQTDKSWNIQAYSRNAGSQKISSLGIPIPSGVQATYYIRLQRISPTKAILSVCNNPDYTDHLNGSPRCFDVPLGVLDLNALNHEVQAEESCNRVFNGVVDHLKIDNGLPCLPLWLNPSFTLTSYCEGQPIAVDGSANAGQPVSTHTWSFQQCNSTGSGTGPIWSHTEFGQPAASYTFPDYLSAFWPMTCGNFFRISLTVRSCIDEQTAIQIVQIACPLTIETGPDVTICEGESTTLNVNYTGSMDSKSVRWSLYPSDETLYDGPLVSYSSVTVSPSVTSHYQVTVSDDVTGCSTYSIINVDVYPNDPSFDLIVDTNNANYALIDLVPDYLNGLTIPGFDYLLTIEELDPTNQYYLVSSVNTDCWSAYPANETFKGFTSTGTALYTQTPVCGTSFATPGMFLYGHTYRFTRVVMNDYCAPKQVAHIIKPVKSGGFMVYEDPNAPDITALLLAKHASAVTGNVTIFPNPSTGIFTIALEEGTDIALIEVTNALGQQVKSFETKGQQSELDMTGFAKGIYVVTIVSNGNTTTKKIMLE